MGKKATKQFNKVSYKKIMEAKPNGLISVTNVTVGTGENAVSYTITPSLTLDAHMEMVNFIVSMVLNYREVDGKVQINYAPEAREFAIQVGSAIYYTNIELTKDIHEAWKFLKAYDVYREIVDASDCYDVVYEADQKIKHALNTMNNHSGLDAMAESFGDIIKKAGETITAEDLVAALKNQENLQTEESDE